MRGPRVWVGDGFVKSPFIGSAVNLDGVVLQCFLAVKLDGVALVLSFRNLNGVALVLSFRNLNKLVKNISFLVPFLQKGLRGRCRMCRFLVQVDFTELIGYLKVLLLDVLKK